MNATELVKQIAKCHVVVDGVLEFQVDAALKIIQAALEPEEKGGEWYCRNCGYLSASRVDNDETCDECHIPVEWHDFDKITAFEEAEKKIEKLEDEIKCDDKLLVDRKELLEAIPECPRHGACMPHALKWIEEVKSKINEATRDFESIIIRCKEGDPRVDWLKTIDCIADEAIRRLRKETQ